MISRHKLSLRRLSRAMQVSAHIMARQRTLFNSKYGLRWRIATAGAAMLISISIVLPIIEQIIEVRSYKLDADTLALVGQTDTRLANRLSFDSMTNTYKFNKDAIKNDAENPFASMQTQVGAPSEENRNDPLYALDVPKDGNKGVTYYDVNSGLSFNLTPQFDIKGGRNIDNYLVYPLGDGLKAVYTLKNNGLKEDIIVKKATSDTMSFAYTLELPETLTVKVIPDGDGALGIYSADPALFGNITYSTDSDRQAVKRAQVNSEKSYLVFGLPRPIIKDLNGKTVGDARFELVGNTLKVVANGLSNLPMPVSIDPSVVVTSATDFQYGGNDDGSINFDASGQISRKSLIGGSLASGTWSTGTSLGAIQYVMGFATYNGYIYALGGNGGNNNVYRAQIQPDGSINGWSSTASMNISRSYLGAAAYNGYLYAWGGYDMNANTPTDTVEYAKILSDGLLGTWQTTTSMTTSVCRAAYASYGGFIYTMGGSTAPTAACANTSASAISTVQYAPLKADGTVGAWQTTTALNYGTGGAIMGAMAGAYNGYMYVMGGTDAPLTTIYTNVQFAPIHDDGTLGSWVATTAMAAGVYRTGYTIYDGYMYITSDQNSATTVRYAPIYANGRIGVWRTTTALTTGRWGAGLVGYKDYLYFAGGTGSQEINYIKINPAGRPAGFSNGSNTLSSGRSFGCSAAYNGYIYTVGGSTAGNTGSNVTTVQYTSLGATTGNTGTWATTGALTTATGGAGCIAYNGRLYVVGGYTGTGGSGTLGNNVYYATLGSTGSIASWTTGTNTGLPTSSWNKLFVYTASGTTYLYSVGTGANGATSYTYRSVISSSGSVGSWSRAENNTSQSVFSTYEGRAAAQVGKYLYLMGGIDVGGGNIIKSAVYYATIQSDGMLSDWQATTSMNSAAAYAGNATNNGCIYSLGGEDGAASSLATVQFACPKADGTIDTWYAAPNLNSAVSDMSVAVFNGYIYLVAGFTTGTINTSQYSYIDNGGSGSIDTWTSGTNLPSARRGHTALVYSGRIYVYGGLEAGGYLNDVIYSTIADDGSLGAWVSTSSFSTARAYFGAVMYNGYAYVVGGYNNNLAGYYADAQYAPINSDGTLGTWSSLSGSSLPTAIDGFTMLAYRGYAYAIGGYDGTADYATVQYAPINSDGTLGTWTTTTSFTNVRSFPAAQVYNGYLYVIGGGSGVVYNDVQYAPINSDGTVGSWSYTSSFRGARYRFASSIYNGYLYIFGGMDKTPTYFNDAQYAPINSDGTLGTWHISAGGAAFSSTAKGYNTAIPYLGNLYVLGGHDGTNYSLETRYAPINAPARSGRYTKIIDFGATVTVSSITYNGLLPNGYSPGLSPVTFKAAGSNSVFGSSTLYSNIVSSPTNCDTSNQAFTRYLLVSIVLDDTTGGGSGGIFADSNATNAYMTDLAISYMAMHPTPDIRLRAGKTLQNGSLSPLDTCYP